MTTIMLALLGSAGFLGLIGTLIQQFFARGKNRVDAAAGIINASTEVVAQMRNAREDDLRQYQQDLKAREHVDNVIMEAVPPIIAWLDGGAQPPPPEVTEELRGVLAMLIFLRTSRARETFPSDGDSGGPAA